MDIICKSLDEIIEKSRERGCEYLPMESWVGNDLIKHCFSWYAGGDHLIFVPDNHINVQINTNEIKEELRHELGLNKEILVEVVSETYLQGYRYELIRTKESRDEFESSRRKRVKRKGAGEIRDNERDQRGAC